VCVCVCKKTQLCFDLTPSWLLAPPPEKIPIRYPAKFWVRRCNFKMCIFQAHCSVESNCCLLRLLTTYAQSAMFHLSIFACWLQVALDQGFQLLPNPLRLSYATGYARPVWFACPYCTLILHIAVSHTPPSKSCQRNSNLHFSRNFQTLHPTQWVKGVQLTTYVYPVPSWIRYCKLYCFSYININWQIVHSDNPVLFIFPSDFKWHTELAKNPFKYQLYLFSHWLIVLLIQYFAALQIAIFFVWICLARYITLPANVKMALPTVTYVHTAPISLHSLLKLNVT